MKWLRRIYCKCVYQIVFRKGMEQVYQGILNGDTTHFQTMAECVKCGRKRFVKINMTNNK